MGGKKETKYWAINLTKGSLSGCVSRGGAASLISLWQDAGDKVAVIQGTRFEIIRTTTIEMDPYIEAEV